MWHPCIHTQANDPYVHTQADVLMESKKKLADRDKKLQTALAQQQAAQNENKALHDEIAAPHSLSRLSRYL